MREPLAAIGKAARMQSEDAAFFSKEAVYQAAAQLERSTDPSARRVILWLTDNFPNVPDTAHLRDHVKGLTGAQPHTEAEAIRKMHEAGAVVMPILLKDRMAGVAGSRDDDGVRSGRTLKKIPARRCQQICRAEPEVPGQPARQRLSTSVLRVTSTISGPGYTIGVIVPPKTSRRERSAT